MRNFDWKDFWNYLGHTYPEQADREALRIRDQRTTDDFIDNGPSLREKLAIFLRVSLFSFVIANIVPILVFTGVLSLTFPGPFLELAIIAGIVAIVGAVYMYKFCHGTYKAYQNYLAEARPADTSKPSLEEQTALISPSDTSRYGAVSTQLQVNAGIKAGDDNLQAASHRDNARSPRSS